MTDLIAEARHLLLVGQPARAAALLRDVDEPAPAVLATRVLAEIGRIRFTAAVRLSERRPALATLPEAATLSAATALAVAVAGPPPGADAAATDQALDVAVREAEALPEALWSQDLFGRYLLAEAGLAAGRPALAEAVADSALSLLSERDLLAAWFVQARARSLAFQGRLDEAEEATAALQDAASRARVECLSALALGLAAFLAAQRGNRSFLRACVDQVRGLPGQPSDDFFRAGAWTLCAYGLAIDGQHPLAVETLLSGLGGPGLPRMQAVDRAYGYELLAGAAVATGDLVAAGAWLHRAESLPASRVTAPSVDRTRALVTTATGDGAATHSPDPRQVHDPAARERRRPGRRARSVREGWDGLTSREREVALLVADGLTSRQVARTLQVSERTVHSHLTAVMTALGARSRAALPRAVPRQLPVPASPAPALTSRQLEVAKLVADGRTNRQIADRLGVSPKTVEKHIAAVFIRWGVSSRTGLAARLHATDSREPADA